MNEREIIEQLESLIEAWQLDEADLNQIDINAIKQMLDKNKKLKEQKEVIDKAIKYINYNNRYRNGADIYQFVDIKGEILEPLKDILEQNEENSNIYLKEFNDWLKEVE